MNLKNLDGQKGILRILVYLLDQGKKLAFRILLITLILYYNIVKKSSSLLREYGLVNTRVDSSTYPPRNMISLTEKGKKVAEHLKKVEEVLEE